MPTAAPKPCLQPGCVVLVRDGTSRCQAHKVKAWLKSPGELQGRGGRPWRRQRDGILQRDAGLCQACLRAKLITPAAEVDHIKSLAEGGSRDDSNLEALCGPCHRAKTLAEARRGRGGAISTAPQADTDSQARFFGAQVLGKISGAGA